jgi:ubiquinone/menaquinone biosynthesis C-methylase UbiE
MTTTADPQHVAEHERTTWNRCAPIYIETLEPLTKQGFQVISDSGHIRDGVRLLDVGCGPASFTAAFARMGADVSGVDFSEDMVEIAKNEQPHLDIRHADVENLPFEDESFDVVTASYALHHLARPTVAFRSIHRVLKPSGRFVFVIPNQEAQKSFGAFFMAVVAHHELEAMPGGPLLMETDMAVVSELIKDAGFLECQIEPLEVNCQLASLEPLIRAGREFADLSTLPKELSDRIETSTYDNAAPYKQPDGTYVFPDAVFYGTAMK